jgi:Mg-chelatase subunit ChlD
MSKNTWTIFSVAGGLALVALIVGLASSSTGNVHPKPITVIKEGPKAAPRLDVVFTIDATGSMGDEIEVVKQQIWDIANKLMAGKPSPDIRFGLVFYQDKGDSFLVKKTDLTRNVDAIHSELMAVTAGGGGDWREHVGRGLHEGLSLNWDQGANVSRLMYLVGDAPGHDDYNDGYGISAAIERAQQIGVRINVVGCSGIDTGRAEFERIARATSGTYTDLTYSQVVTDQNGNRKSVVYFDGDYYEADGELERKDWSRGGRVLLKEKRIRKASPAIRAKAASPGASTDNNLGDAVFDSVKAEAESLGVAY